MEVIVDNSILKKKLNTFKSDKGTLRDVSSDVVSVFFRELCRFSAELNA